MRISKKLIFAVIAVLAAAYFYNREDKAPEESPGVQKAEEIIKMAEISQASGDIKQEVETDGFGEEQKILSFDMTGYTRDGKKKWDIWGKSADIISDIAILSDIKAHAYSDERTVTLKADSGRYDKKGNSIRLEDNVVVTTSDGLSLEAEWLRWESETEEITTDSFVEVRKDNLYASGRGASASTAHKEVQLDKDIVVKQDEITINCAGPLIIDYGKNKASFYDRVKVTEPRGELTADRLNLFLNSESQEIERVVAEGNVELRQDANVAKGQKIIYTLASGQAVLTGNPEILIYSKEDMGDALTGD